MYINNNNNNDNYIIYKISLHTLLISVIRKNIIYYIFSFLFLNFLFKVKMSCKTVNQEFEANISPSIECNLINGIMTFLMDHEQEYTIDIGNYTNRRADADILVDGKSIGVFRLNPYQSFKIERTINQERKLTFLCSDSEEFRESGNVEGKYNNGMIEVYIYPEIQPENIVYIPAPVASVNYSLRSPSRSSLRSSSRSSLQSPSRSSLQSSPRSSLQSTSTSRSLSNYSEGATGMGRHSYQKFQSVDRIVRDNRVILIRMRLVCSRRKYSAVY